MHHVMPSVCGCHFHKLRPEFEAICAEHGVRLNTRTDISHAWRTFIARIFELSSPELTPAWAAREYGPGDAGAGGARWHLAQHAPLLVYFLTPAATYVACSALF